ncbi:MAG: histidine phosphatase family protein [Planctomycetales bacterium]|nr:histidine phosphatase family protein [Planctomycetales bacterium]
MKLFLIRHAQSANNALPEHQRIEDPPITDLGHRQAAALGQWMGTARLTHLVASPFRRSLQTAEYVHRTTGLVPEVWVDLHEQGGCYSGWEPPAYEGRPGMSHVEISAQFPGWIIESAIDHTGWWKSQPYESFDQARVRARRLIGRTKEQFAATDAHVAYVMHADFKRLVLAELFADTLARDAHWPTGIYNTAVSVVEISPRHIRLDQFNSTGHLAFELVSG